MVKDILKDLIYEKLGHIKTSRKGWKTRNCMMCHTKGESRDTRGRFGILVNGDGSIAVRCFNCKFSAKFVPGEQFSKHFEQFLREIGFTNYDIKKLNFELFKEKTNQEVSPEIKLKDNVLKRWVPMSLPEDSYPISTWAELGCNDKSFLSVVEYCYSRGIRNFNDIYWTPSKNAFYNKRFILPFRYKGNIVGYTGRFAGTPPEKSIPKYHNNMPDDYIYNLDNQSHWSRKYVILAEGVLDAYFTDGISASGNTINEEQIQIIKSLNKDIIVIPDNDKDGGELVKIALKEKWAIAFPNWGKDIKDAGAATEKYGRILTVQSIIKSAEFNPISAKLKWDLKQKR